MIIIVVLGPGFFLLNKKNDPRAQLGKKGTCSIFGRTVEAPVQTANNIFKLAPAKIEAINKITPGSQTGDPRFTYLWIKGGKEVPVFAPADGVLVKITYKTRVGVDAGMLSPDYDLTFLSDCQTLYQINHITNPIPGIAALRPNEQPHKLTKGSPISEQDTLPKQNITIRAGTQLGTTTGTPNAHNFDFGIFVDRSAVCPYSKFEELLRSEWLALFRGNTCEVSGTY